MSAVRLRSGRRHVNLNSSRLVGPRKLLFFFRNYLLVTHSRHPVLVSRGPEMLFWDTYRYGRLTVATRATRKPTYGSVASFGTEQEFAEKTSFLGILGGHFEEFVDELILTPNVMPAQPPHLALPNYVYRLITLNRS